MAPGNRPDLDRLTAAVDALGTAFANIATETLTPDTLPTASTLANRAANMIDGFRADLARKARNLQPPGTPTPTSSRALNPNGQRPTRQPERDSERADLYDDYGELGDATRRGELPGDYADAINTATKQLSPTEHAEFTNRYRDTLTKQALTTSLHEFRIHLRHLVDEHCRASELERARRLHRNRRGRLWDDPSDDMTKLFAQFDPETGARIRKAIDEEIDRIYRTKRDDPNDHRTHQHIVADAITNLITGARNSSTSRTELVVLIDLDTLLHDQHRRPPGNNRSATGNNQPGADTNNTTTATADHDDAANSSRTAADAGGDGTTAAPADHDDAAHGPEPADDGASAGTDRSEPRTTGRCCETSDGTPLPIESIRRLACNADIIPAVLNGDGVVLDLGRTQRLASTGQRQALRVMYPHCAVTGCTTAFDRCEIHHTNPWSPPTNGTTNIDTLIPVCARHHHHIHDHHLQLTLHPTTRTLTITHPNGTQELHPLPTRRRRRTPPLDEIPKPA